MGRANAIQKRTSHITVVVTAPEIQGKKIAYFSLLRHTTHGQKTHPIGYRWATTIVALAGMRVDYAKLLHQDVKIRKMVKAEAVSCWRIKG